MLIASCIISLICSLNLHYAIAEVVYDAITIVVLILLSLIKSYLIEVNFYSGGGSKLNEVARSYSELAPKINALNGFEFVWITDGIGWKSAKNKLEEAFYTIPHIYNLTNINDFIEIIKND